MKKTKFKKIFKIISMSAIAVYVIGILITQQKTLSSYSKEQKYVSDQIKEQTEYKQTLANLKENVNSPEYIEEVAREKLDMYLPNERVYVDVNK